MGLGPQVGDHDPTTEVANTHRGLRKPRWGRQSAAPTPPPWSLASFVGAYDLGGGVGVADQQPRPLPLFLFEF
ncbi:hypothetical protein CRG98_005948 [Punica granatum]|uniref:Uncharacterized protein n=1 Tax=Punica granatum TaxID=22663 RepID=A0A2I0KZ02_PUNGR|nr:hypothetical protein CRG98_005948 [Punica granatum]